MKKALFSILIVIGILLVATIFIAFRSSKSPLTTSTPGVPSASTGEAIEVSFRELAHGSQSTVSRRANYIIMSPTELSALWKMIDAGGEAPTVDFSANEVVAVFAGDKPTAGYDIEVIKVEDAGTRLVNVVLTKPGGSCLLAEVQTNPYQIIEVPKTALTLTHEDQTTTPSCLP